MKVSKIIMFLYTILFLLVVFCGNQRVPIFNYTSELMAVMGVLLVIGYLCSKKEFGLSSSRIQVFLYIVIFAYIIMDYFKWSIYPECTDVYVKRFIFYFPLVLINASMDSIEKIIQVSKYYILIIAMGFIILYPSRGVNGSFLGSYQEAAGALSIGLLFLVVDYLFKEEYTYKDVLMILFIAGTLLMTGKRTFTVIPVCIMLLLTFIKTGNNTSKVKFKRLLNIFLPAIVLGGIILAIKPDIFLALSRLKETSQDAGMNGRKNFWDLAMYLWSEYKWTVIGMGTYQEFIARNMPFTYKAFRVQAAYAAHNIYYQMLAEIGCIGFILFIVYFVYNLSTSIKVIRFEKTMQDNKISKYAYLSLIIQVWFLLYGFTGNPLYLVNQFYIYLFAIMIDQSIKREIRKRMRMEKNEVNGHNSCV